MREQARYLQLGLGILLGAALMVPVTMFSSQSVSAVQPFSTFSMDAPITQVAVSGWQEQYHSGIQAYRKGQYQQGANWMRQVLEQRPDYINAHYYLAVCLDLINQEKEALSHYQTVWYTSTETRIREYAHERMEALSKQFPQVPSQAMFSGASATFDLPAMQPGKLSHAMETAIVPLKSSRNALMVEATLTNQKTGKRVKGTFILDTGATYTSISQEMAEALGLELQNTEQVHITTANGKIDVPKVMIDKLQIEGVEANHVQATVIHVRPDSSFSGLLGLSFIRQFKMTIDPDANQLVFEQHAIH